MTWQDRTEVIKGTIGEKIVETFLKKNGWSVYKAITEGGHCFDILAVKNREELRIVEVKTKARRTHYPDTGINVKHYKEYKAISEKHNLRVFIIFVDEHAKKAYGNFLNELEKRTEVKEEGICQIYPLVQFGIIYFPLSKMNDIATLNDDEAEELKKYSTRNYEYKTA